MRVTFNELAERELNDAAQYYEREQTGLGAAFITEVQRCTAVISEHPKLLPWSSERSGADCVSDFPTASCTRSRPPNGAFSQS